MIQIAHNAESELGLRKPSPETPLDAQHPLLRGCRFFTPLNEGAGSRAYDPVGQRVGALSATDLNAAWGFDALTLAGGTTGHLDFLQPMPNPVGRGHTLLLEFTAGALLASYNVLFMAYNSDDSPACALWVADVNDAMRGRLYYGSSNCYCYTTASTITAGTHYQVAVTWDGGTVGSAIRFYVNGVEAAYLGASSGATISAGGSWRLAYDNRTYCAGMPGAYRYFAWFDRILSLAEIRAFQAAPFCAFAGRQTPPRRPLARQARALWWAVCRRRLRGGM